MEIIIKHKLRGKLIPKAQYGIQVPNSVRNYWKEQGVVLPLSRDEQVSTDNRTKELKEAQERDRRVQKAQNVGNALIGLSNGLRDYAAMGVSMLNPTAGLILGLTDADRSIANGDLVQGGIQAGLEVLPYGVSKVPVARKAIKQGVKTYGTKAANKVENILPKVADGFHTWNAKDNIKNATRQEVVAAKKSRLMQNQPNYTFNDRYRFVDENKGMIRRDAEQAMPFQHERIKKINNPKRMSDNDMVDIWSELYPSTARDLRTNEAYRLKNLNRINGSYFDMDKGIHTGTHKVDKFGDFVPDTQFNIGTVYNHELDHYVSFPNYGEVDAMSRILNSNLLPSGLENYYTRLNRIDTKARLGQFKDLFLLKNNEPISQSQLRTAIKMYTHPNRFGTFNNFQGTNRMFKQADIPALQQFMNTTSLRDGGKVEVI